MNKAMTDSLDWKEDDIFKLIDYLLIWKTRSISSYSLTAARLLLL